MGLNIKILRFEIFRFRTKFKINSQIIFLNSQTLKRIHMEYKKLNNYLGWAVFAIATMVYVLTLEPTTSLWDCGEYITTAYKLEVGHPPGAPLFMMLGRLFTVFADTDSAAYMVNLMSALSSSFSILFLFWSITLIAKKIVLFPNDNLFSKSDKTEREQKTSLSAGEKWAVLGSGIIGALAYAFTDSFWFSAVEGEVYAMSSFFTAVVVWAILKWDAELTAQELFPNDEAVQSKHPDRWIIVIFFIIGLSIGVHLLNLLTVPAIAFIIYYKKFRETTPQGFLLVGIIGIVTLGLIQNVIIPMTINIAGGFERIFKNSLGLPFNSGAIFFFVLLTAAIVALLVFSKKRNNPLVNTVTWSGTMLLIGYTCFAMIVIRSNANPPLDENDPENLVNLESYLKREQYGESPLLYGQYFNAEPEKNRAKWADRTDVHLRRFVVYNKATEKDLAGFQTEAEANAYAAKVGGEVIEKYYKTFDGEKQKRTYDPNRSTFFPRMYSPEARHIRGYVSWSGAKANRTPKFSENLAYFARYQVNWMYWRYFMWNFSGRQNDEQGHGDARNGNWMSGLNFIDKHHIGDQTKAPAFITQNAAHNKFYMLPLALGLIGFIFTMIRASKLWWFVMLLFLLTGLAIIVYLNQPPFQPRERDYAFAASFYAFAIWIGLGVLGLYNAFKTMNWNELGKIAGVLAAISLILFLGGTTSGIGMIYLSVLTIGSFALMIALQKGIKQEVQASFVAILIAVPIPLVLGMQGWDDHDRSGRYTAQALAHNYLVGCEGNAIIFTNGDNDTFPLWYLQEVEGEQTDVRVANLSLFSTDWYTAQMKRKAYESEPLPISFEEHEYRQHQPLDVVYVQSSNQLTMSGNDLDSKTRKIMDVKIKTNPREFAAGFKTACDKLHSILAATKLAEQQPETVANVKTFYQGGGDKYLDFRKFVFNILRKSSAIGLSEAQFAGVQRLLQEFNDSFDYLPLDYAINYLHNTNNTIDAGGDRVFLLPTKGFVTKINKENAKKMVDEKDYYRIADEMRWKLPGGKNHLVKAEIMILDIINNFNWERNIYFAGSAAPSTYIGLDNYFFSEGLIYKLVPLNISKSRNPNSLGEMNKERTYENLMTNYKWGNMEKEGILIDYYTKRGINNYRIQFSVLADAYAETYQIAQQKIEFLSNVNSDSVSTEVEKLKAEQALAKERVVELLNRSLELMPQHKVPFGRIIPFYVGSYYAVGAVEEGDKLAVQLLDALEEELDYYLDVDPEFGGSMLEEASAVYRSMFTIYQTTNMYKSENEELKTRLDTNVKKYMAEFQNRKSAYQRAGYLKNYNSTIGGFLNQITR